MIKVGPILTKDLLSEAFVQAICDENVEAKVIDRGSYYRIEVPYTCILKREAVEKYAKRKISFPSDLEQVMPSFTGELLCDEDRVTWSLK